MRLLFLKDDIRNFVDVACLELMIASEMCFECIYRTRAGTRRSQLPPCMYGAWETPYPTPATRLIEGMGLDLKTGWKDREREKIGLNAAAGCSPSMQYCSYGRELAEVLSVSYKGRGDPSCTIVVYDGKSGQIIYTQTGQGDIRESRKYSNSGTQVCALACH